MPKSNEENDRLFNDANRRKEEQRAAERHMQSEHDRNMKTIKETAASSRQGSTTGGGRPKSGCAVLIGAVGLGASGLIYTADRVLS